LALVAGAPAEGHRRLPVSDARRGKWSGPFKNQKGDTLSLGAPSSHALTPYM